MKNTDWSLTRLPPEGDADVGEFFHSLYEIAKAEQDRLKIRERALENHALYRGKHHKDGKKQAFTPVNLFFANVERTVSNITANNPQAEVIDLDGFKDFGEEIVTARLKNWWKETKQRRKHKDSARQMEIYGYTPEKPWWDYEKKVPNTSVMDPFAVIPAPGVWQDWALDLPYLCFLYVDTVDALEAKYGVEGIATDETYSLMGEEREEHNAKQITSGSRAGSKNAYGNYADTMHPVSDKPASAKLERGLVIEIWIRGAEGKSKEIVPVLDDFGYEIIDPNTGETLLEEITYPKYPDGIRKVTITKADQSKAKTKDKSRRGILVLDDIPNPNINMKITREIAKTTYPWGRLPIYKADSYRDTTSSYGFSAAEQVGDLLLKIERIFTRLYAYAKQALSPGLIIEKHCGITREMIEAQAGKSRLILMPTKPNADIRYLETPNLPATFFRVLELFLSFFDRIYQIEDADRGENPQGVRAASAIVALQERNAVLMQSKIDSSDSLCSERGMWAIGFWQNFGTKEELIEVNGSQATFRGVDYAGRRLNYAVEVGSTVPKTSLQIEEQVKWLASLRLVDLRTVLETLNFPNWKAIVERNGESQLDMALSILIQAGLSKEEAATLKQWLMQPQGGPGDLEGGEGKPSPGTPTGAQGQQPTERRAVNE